MEDVYMNVGRLVFALLESLSIIETTKNIDTLISRYHCAVITNSMLCDESTSEGYITQVQMMLEKYKTVFVKKVVTDIHAYIVTYPCKPCLQMFCYGILLRGLATYYAEQMVAVNNLKACGSKIKRLKKLCSIIDKVKKEISAIALVDQKGILNADEALSNIDNVKRDVEIAINEILKGSRKK
jgi:hypothetical protein